jgi:hypothetical protein
VRRSTILVPPLNSRDLGWRDVSVGAASISAEVAARAFRLAETQPLFRMIAPKSLVIESIHSGYCAG